jgi:hypothetical protein
VLTKNNSEAWTNNLRYSKAWAGIGTLRAHVVEALQVLELMAEEMEELRERVAAPELVGDAIPIDVHIKSGLEKLKQRRIQ